MVGGRIGADGQKSLVAVAGHLRGGRGAFLRTA